MRDADGTIERLLSGLRDAEPPGGMERRILEALDGMGAREAAASTSLWRRPLRPAIAMLVACTVILMVSFTVQQRKHVPGQQFVPLKPTEGLNGAPGIVSSRRVGPKRQHAPARPHRGTTQTASFPAPPLPLTEQEKLLLRLAHRGDSDTTAILNPDVRAAQTAKATEQFQQFFAINAKEMRSQSE
jgi:hypothetical protein